LAELCFHLLGFRPMMLLSIVVGAALVAGLGLGVMVLLGATFDLRR
jgi:hypothetical protein